MFNTNIKNDYINNDNDTNYGDEDYDIDSIINDNNNNDIKMTLIITFKVSAYQLNSNSVHPEKLSESICAVLWYQTRLPMLCTVISLVPGQTFAREARLKNMD